MIFAVKVARYSAGRLNKVLLIHEFLDIHNDNLELQTFLLQLDGNILVRIFVHLNVYC